MRGLIFLIVTLPLAAYEARKDLGRLSSLFPQKKRRGRWCAAAPVEFGLRVGYRRCPREPADPRIALPPV